MEKLIDAFGYLSDDVGKTLHDKINELLNDILVACGVNIKDLEEVQNRVVLVGMQELYIDGEFMGKFKIENSYRRDGTRETRIYFLTADQCSTLIEMNTKGED